MPFVSVVVGNPRTASKTRRIGVAVAESFVGPEDTVHVVELADCAHEVFDLESSRISTIVETIQRSDLVIMATPTFKGSYSGLLKAFLDHVPHDGLRGSVVIPVCVGGSAEHSLAPNATLLPLLVGLGAIVPGGGHYVIDAAVANDVEFRRAIGECVSRSRASIAAVARAHHWLEEALNA